MNAPPRASAAALVIALPVSFLGIAHAFYVHLARTGVVPTFSPVHHPEAAPLLAVAVGSVACLVGLAVAARRWLAVEAHLGAVQRVAQPRVIAGQHVRVFETDSPQLFAAGIRQPSIFASSGALSVMAPTQIAAAVLHERAHIANDDTRFRPVLSGLRFAMGWVPPVRRAVDQVVLREECRADACAIRAGASAYELANAILAVNAAGGRFVAGLNDGAVALRLRMLVDPGERLPGRPGAVLAAMATALLAFPVIAHAVLVCVS